MRLRVVHTTTYEYSAPITDSHTEMRLMPVTDAGQTCVGFTAATEPSAPVFSYDLPSGRVHHFNRRAPHTAMTITAQAQVVTHRSSPFAGPALADHGRFYARDDVREDCAEYLMPTRRVPLLPEADRYGRPADDAEADGAAASLMAIVHALHEGLTYAPGSTTVDTPLADVITVGHGVCQDFTHLMLAVCRRRGVPARYVSGYLFTGHAPDAGPDAPDDHLVSGDATHAWVECLLPDGRWYGFDPTNNIAATDAYVKIHHGRDYDDVAPLRGLYHGAADQRLDVSVRVFADG